MPGFLSGEESRPSVAVRSTIDAVSDMSSRCPQSIGQAELDAR